MSSLINEIEKLYAKEKTYKIPRESVDNQEQATVKITPFTLDKMNLLDMKKDASLEEMSGHLKRMMSISTGLPEETFDKVSFEFFEEFIAAIMDANNFKDEDVKKMGIKDFMEKKRQQIKEKDDATKSSE